MLVFYLLSVLSIKENQLTDRPVADSAALTSGVVFILSPLCPLNPSVSVHTFTSFAEIDKHSRNLKFLMPIQSKCLSRLLICHWHSVGHRLSYGMHFIFVVSSEWKKYLFILFSQTLKPHFSTVGYKWAALKYMKAS